MQYQAVAVVIGIDPLPGWLVDFRLIVTGQGVVVGLLVLVGSDQANRLKIFPSLCTKQTPAIGSKLHLAVDKRSVWYGQVGQHVDDSAHTVGAIYNRGRAFHDLDRGNALQGKIVQID